MRLFVTGAAGFIGYHVAKACLLRGDEVVSMDNLDPYYDVKLKHARLAELKNYEKFSFYEANLIDRETIEKIMQQHKPQRVIHLAAQAGVRYSMLHPHDFIQSNVVGFTNMIEASKNHGIEHFVYASTSSVYGANSKQPYQESDAVHHPLSIYAATKQSNELIAHTYAHLYQLPSTGLRFFTVYGPWGRPDMALFSFTHDILAEKPLQVFNYGNMQRDFTYIDDIVTGILLATDKVASPDPKWNPYTPDSASSCAPYRIYNIGLGCTVPLMECIEFIEQAVGKKAMKELLPLQAGDVLSTHADTARLELELGYRPKVALKEGVQRFVQWYLEYYQSPV